MREILLVTLVGLPASGKSSLCRKLSTCFNRDYTIIWIHFDDLIPVTALHPLPESESQLTDWKQSRQLVCNCVERHIQICRNLVEHSHPTDECRLTVPNFPSLPNDIRSHVIFLLDDNFYYSSMRHMYYVLAKRYDSAYASIVCNASISECIERNQTRETAVPEYVISKMHARLEWPDPTQNRWEEHTFVLNTSSESSSDSLDSLETFLINSSKKPFSYASELEQARQREVDRKANTESVLHQIDIQIRSSVQAVMRSHDSKWKAKYAKRISDLKSDILNAMHTRLLTGNSDGTVETYQQEAGSLFENKLADLLSS